MTENERFGLLLAKTGSINSGTGHVSSLGFDYVTKHWSRNPDFGVLRMLFFLANMKHICWGT
jgi:hypothetical protein